MPINLFVIRGAEIKEARLLLAIVMSLVIHSSVIYYSKYFQPRLPIALTDVKQITLTFASLNPVVTPVVESANNLAPAISKAALTKPAPPVKEKSIGSITRFKNIAPKQMTKAIAHKSKIQNSTFTQPMPTPLPQVKQVITKQERQDKNNIISMKVNENSDVKVITKAGKLTNSQTPERQLAVRLNPKFRSPPRPPVYPRQSIRRHQQGTALIRAKISRFGNVVKLIIHQTSNFDVLDQAAMAAVRKWQFEPARNNGYNIASWVQVPVNFVLKQR